MFSLRLPSLFRPDDGALERPLELNTLSSSAHSSTVRESLKNEKKSCEESEKSSETILRFNLVLLIWSFFLADFARIRVYFFCSPAEVSSVIWRDHCAITFFFGVGVKIEFEEFKRARFGASTSKDLFDIDESSLVTGVVCCVMSFVRIERPNRSWAAANVRKI